MDDGFREPVNSGRTGASRPGSVAFIFQKVVNTEI